MQDFAAVVLAAGDGKRMMSKRPKVCCEFLFKPMLSWLYDCCRRLGLSGSEVCTVVADNPGEAADLVP